MTTQRSSSRSMWTKIGGIASVLTIIGLIVAILQLLQDKQANLSSDAAEATVIALIDAQLAVQQQIGTTQAQHIQSAPTGTAIAVRITQLQATQQALEAARQQLQAGEQGGNGPINATLSTNPSTPHTGSIPFASPNDPNTLNPLLGWQQGNSTANGYEIDAGLNTVKLIADRKTDQWQRINTAPMLLLPIEGDFEVQVKLQASPNAEGQLAGLGARSAQNNTTWIRIDKNVFQNQHIVGTAAAQEGEILTSSRGHDAYPNDIVYLKIERHASLFTLSYSNNGVNWVARQRDYVFSMPHAVEIYLFAFSARNDGGFIANFSDLAVLRK